MDYIQDFNLFITTRNPSPALPPDSPAVVTIVNFTTTRAGLTTQVTIPNETSEMKIISTSIFRLTQPELSIFAAAVHNAEF